ncbi:O-antigen ligase [Jannaschia sp. AI_61]|uniref:O-antigen ligase family protein n=1 Tax=Jannaschia sp. AI_61 TaxID=2829796 RepID=UPI0021022957|nr:O-antigen ligase family protein [Jannaschia sp. AI_61]
MAVNMPRPAMTSHQGVSGVGLPWPALLYLLCVVLPLWMNLGPIKLSVLRILLLAITVPLLVQVLMGRFGRVMAIDLLMIAHTIWIGVALYVNNPGQMVTQVGSVGLEFLGGYLVARAYVRTPEAFIALCRWILLIVVLLLPFALIETQTGYPPLVQILKALPVIDTVPIVHQEKRMGLDRAQVVFVHPIHFGLFCSISVALVFVALKDVVSTPVRWGGAILSGMAGFLALSSGALLAIALQVALIGWASLFHRIRWRWWLLVGLFAMAWVAIDLLSNRSPMRVFMSYATFSAHNAYWRSIIFEWGMKSVWAHPLYGIGLNDWVRPDFMFSGSMDNFWLVMAVRYGIPGFLCVAGAYVLGVFQVMRRSFDEDATLRHIRRAWVFIMLGLAFTLATVHVWATIYSFVFFMFGAGLWLAGATPRDDRSHGDTATDGDPSDASPGHARGRVRAGATSTSRNGLQFRRFETVTPAHRRPREAPSVPEHP